MAVSLFSILLLLLEVRLVQSIRPFVTAVEVRTETVRRWLSAADTLPTSQPVERPERPLTAANLELMELDVQGSVPPPPVLRPADGYGYYGQQWLNPATAR